MSLRKRFNTKQTQTWPPMISPQVALALAFAIALSGCAGVASVNHPLTLAANQCEFDTARAGAWPWSPQMCLTSCEVGNEVHFFAGCSSEGGLISEVKSTLGVIPTFPVTSHP